MQRILIIALAVGVLLSAAAFFHGVTPASAAGAAEQTKDAALVVGGGARQRWDCVAFAAAGEIYVVNLDGTGLTRLTANDDADRSPAFSPDGTKIAFVSNREDDGAVYVMNADGSDERRLSPSIERRWKKDINPGFTPDGERVVATRTLGLSIVIFPLTGGGEEFFQPAGLPPGVNGPRFPAFSPDGKKVAFSIPAGDCSSTLWTANADGSGARQLTKDTAISHAFSPDGKKLAFYTWTEEGWHICVINADGTGRRQLTKGDRECFSPAFSPDGKKIIYVSLSDVDIYVMNADGTGRRQLTGGYSDKWSPAFSPDGKKIIYFSGGDICVMNADGWRQRHLAAGDKDFSLGPSLVEGRLLDSYGNWHDVVEDSETKAPGE